MPVRRLLPLAFAVALAAAACGGDNSGSTSAGAAGAATAASASSGENVTLRLGYFPNITHASALVGVEKGIFADKLGPNVTLAPSAFNAGPVAVEAIFNGAIDATYVGPNPAINAFAKSNGEAIRIISGATSGGAFLVVNPSITKPADLKGKKVATPQLGNTQDVALRSWLKANGLKSREKGGDVQVIPISNPDQLTLFLKGQIDAAWAPEPWAARLVHEGGG